MEATVRPPPRSPVPGTASSSPPGATRPPTAVVGGGTAVPSSPATTMKKSQQGSFIGTGSEDLAASGKQWARLVGPDGQETRVRVDRAIVTSELRKAIKTRVGVPVKQLELKVEGEYLHEGTAQPLLRLDESKWVIHWEIMDRLQSLLATRQLADINSIGRFDRTVLHFAVLDGDPDLCKDILFSKELKEGMVNRIDVFRDSPLMLASILGYLEIVEVLLDRQANPEFQNLCGRTALQLASEHGHDRVCKILMAMHGSLETAPPMIGTMGMTARSKSAPYLARLNERYMVTHRIKLHRLAHRAQPGMDF